jgi:hypothetical protein
MRTTLAARVQLVGLKIGPIHRNRFAARVLELLEMAALTEMSAANCCCGFGRICAPNERRWIEHWP